MFIGEAQLLGWSESHSGGPKLVLGLPDKDDLEPFRVMTVRKGKTAGQLLACLIVEMRDDETCLMALRRGLLEEPAMEPSEQPDEEPVGGPLAKLAGLWCRREDFRAWLAETFEVDVPDEEAAAAVIRRKCNVKSRAQLDGDRDATLAFNELIRRPFMEHLKHERQVDGG